MLPTNGGRRTGKDPVPRDPVPRSQQPNVDSAVVRLLPHARPILTGERWAAFGDLVRGAFAQRSKTLRNNLRGIIEPDAMQAIDIDPGRRAETLSLAEFLVLAEQVERG